ncbi:MAG: 2-phospho-L-lactate guanylyltransferase [Candidatus Helarchaeota archaeon]
MHCTIIPIKSLRTGKKRLQSVLTPSERQTLILTLLQDVLNAATCSKFSNTTLIVTSDLELIKQIKKLAYPNLAFLQEKSAQGTYQAVQYALKWCSKHPITSILIIPADIPLIQANEIDDLIALGRSQNSIVLIPSVRKDGTNAFFQPFPSNVKVWYGPESFKKNLEYLSKNKLPHIILNKSSFALDIDLKEDLLHLLKVNSKSLTSQLVKTFKI